MHLPTFLCACVCVCMHVSPVLYLMFEPPRSFEFFPQCASCLSWLFYSTSSRLSRTLPLLPLPLYLNQQSIKSSPWIRFTTNPFRRSIFYFNLNKISSSFVPHSTPNPMPFPSLLPSLPPSLLLTLPPSLHQPLPLPLPPSLSPPSLSVMQYIEPPNQILRYALMKGLRISTFAEHTGSFIAITLYSTSALALDGGDYTG